MTDFLFPDRFNDNLAEEGVKFEVIDENDNVWGVFKCRLIDRTLPRWRTTMERIQRRYKNDHKTKLVDIRGELFVELSLVDWDMKDAKGKAIPYDKATAIKYFNDPRAKFALEYLFAMAEDVRNFQPDEQEGELPEGN
jgi:hypothetical protein